MLDFIEYLKKEKIVDKLLDNYLPNLDHSGTVASINEILEKLENEEEKIRRRKKSESSKQNHDLIGFFYEKGLDETTRKTGGEFYTPKQVVDYILDGIGYIQVKEIRNKKLIDISCGSGSFLIEAIKRIVSSSNLEILSFIEAEAIVESIRNNICGLDINPIACVLCQINIQHALFPLLEIIRNKKSNFFFPLFKILNQNAIEFIPPEPFDYVVGNPPYVFIRDIPENQRKIIENSTLESIKGQYDLYQLFIEIGIKILKQAGFLGYIIPDSLLALSNRDVIRRYIYNNAKILEIVQMGPQFEDPVVSNVIILLQKEDELNERKSNIMKITQSNSEKAIMLKQDLIERWNYQFLININSKDIEIMEFLENSQPTLEEISLKPEFRISIFRGVELGKEGMIFYCDICGKYHPLPRKNMICRACKEKVRKSQIQKIIHESIQGSPTVNFRRFISALQRYKVKEVKYIDITKKGINYKTLHEYKDRIIIRQLTQDGMICASFDKESLTSQSIYNLRIIESNVSEFNHFYLLGLLNSKLLAYYFRKSFGSYKELFPRILIERLRRLPIKIPLKKKEKALALKIESSVKAVLSLEEEDAEDFQKLQTKIDGLVFDLYEIKDADKSYIFNAT